MTRSMEQLLEFVCIYRRDLAHWGRSSVAHRCDPRYGEVWRCRASLAIRLLTRTKRQCSPRTFGRITKIVKGSEVDRMAPRVIAAETIAAISYSANSLSNHPRRFGTAGTPGNVHPGNFGVVLLVPSLPSIAILIAEVEHCPTFR